MPSATVSNTPDHLTTEQQQSNGSEPTESPKDASKHLVGRINNLITSDVNSLESVASSFIVASTSTKFRCVKRRRLSIPHVLALQSPLQIILSIVFLYQVLGWSAFIGAATIIATFPLPSLLTGYIQEAQRQKAERVRAHVYVLKSRHLILTIATRAMPECS